MREVFNLVLNIIWFLFCGLWLAIAYVVAALICFVLIITIPFGIASLRIASFVIWPFGRTAVPREDAGAASCVGNVIWLVVAGIWLALAHIATSIALAVTIIGIPFAWANLKLIPISLMPLGMKIVRTDEAFAGW
ncbi:YccF domain-containing protein [Actinospica sp. MGRD01-02]|uniref:YccF domain-containing protein n=1 Tax=Actinospica acidithermotolerans TaxID=2828514 RepID=A0A941ENC7_9ACTN|nr:YccF domain-containing protein [Actinospica acidithermotolerans]MBR7830734.1 YccF domain-containing protein [Actinospica acidithermotolerans]